MGQTSLPILGLDPRLQGCWRVTRGDGCAISARMLGAQIPTGLSSLPGTEPQALQGV